MLHIEKILISLCILLAPALLVCQSENDALFLKSIHDVTLGKGSCYQWLDHLSENIGGRLAGSKNSETAIEYTKEVLAAYTDSTYLQECTVPYWIRGGVTTAKITGLGGATHNLKALSLGNSVATASEGLEADVVEVNGLDHVRELGIENISGKIVFYNRPMDPSLVNTFHAYGRAADQRVSGAIVAAEHGAVGVVVRSLTTKNDYTPHTGTLRYKEGIPKIPAIAISTKDADFLSKFMKRQNLKIFMKTKGKMLNEEKLSHNVIGEIKGSEFPDEIILVGGHLDSWDVGGGAHDDGSGCVHSIQVLETFKMLNYQPKRTIRCVLFMNEENGLGGATAYAKASNENGEFHLAAIESDAGGFTPRGFTFDAQDSVFAGYFRQIIGWSDLLDTYSLFLNKGGSGADINPLKSQNGILIGLRPDSQRYFDYHHSRLDRIEAVNERELKLGAAAMTSLVYLLDQYGLERE